MERLFVRILNVTLLILGFATLAGAIGAAVFIALTGYPALFAETGDRHLTVHYQPLNTISGSTTSEAPPQASYEDSDLRRAAEADCQAQARLTSYLTNGALELKLPTCIAGLLSDPIPDRAKNRFDQEAAFFDAAKTDPQIKAKYPPTSDKNVLAGYFEELETKFSTEFNKAAEADDERKARAQIEAAGAKASITAWGALAISTFGSFLFIAFLIVAIRIEKHLGNVEKKLPSAA